MKTIVWWSTILCTMSAIWSSLLEERAACEYHLSLTKYPKDQRVLFSFCYLPFAQRFDHFDHFYQIFQISKKSKGVICYWPLSVNIVDKGKWSPSDQIDHISKNPNIMAHLSLSLYMPTREIIIGITWSMIILRTRNASRRANTNSHLLVISRRPSDHIEDKEFFSAPVLFRAGPTQSNSYEFSSSQYFCPGASSKF